MSDRMKIAIDPGHGGHGDKVGGSSPNNATGPAPRNLKEKDLTLQVANLLRQRLQSGCDVFLTRTGDNNLSLADRAAVARNNHADLFLSIHFNAFSDPSVDGTEVWVAREASHRSRSFAQVVLDRVTGVTGVANRGVRERDLGVLLPSRHDPWTGACLVEIAFLTNSRQASRLEDPVYLGHIADALAEAVRAQSPIAVAHAEMALWEPDPVNDERFATTTSAQVHSETETGHEESSHVEFECYQQSRDDFADVLSAVDEARELENSAPTTLRIRPKRIEARILWPALGFPAVIAPRANGSTDPFEGSPSRRICALILSNQRFLSKEEAAQYLRIVPWSERGRRNIPSGQAGSFDVTDIERVNDDGGKKLVWPNRDEHCDAVVFGGGHNSNPGANPEEDAIAVSLSRHVREFYKRNGLENLHEIRISEAASARFADGQYHLFWNNEAASTNDSSDEMKLLLERFARPRRQSVGTEWGSQADLLDEYKYVYGDLRPPYKQNNSQKRLTEVLHPVFINRQGGPLRIGHVTDAHVHVRADVYEENLKRKATELRKAGLSGASYNNFNRSFTRNYDEAKQRSDALLLTGDLIDYGRDHIGLTPDDRFCDTLGRDDAYHADRNWFLFYYLLASGQNYTRPAYTILGNHDWRFNPYPPFAPGAPDPGAFVHNDTSFNEAQLNEFLKIAHGPGHERKYAYVLNADSDWEAFFKNPWTAAKAALLHDVKQKGSPLQTNIDSVIWYLLLINPFLDYQVKLPGGQQLLMLDWGEDEEIFNPDWPRTWMEFGQRAGKSLTSLQKWHVEDFVSLPGRAKIIGMHAPPIGPYPDWSDSDLANGVKNYEPREDSRARQPDGKIVKLTSHGLFAIRPKDAPFGVAADYGSFTQERDWFIQRVGDPRKGVRLIFAGHIHRNGLIAVSRAVKDHNLWLIHDVRARDVVDVRPPAVATKAEAGTTFLGPLYVNTTSAGPRGNLWEHGHSYVAPGYRVVNLAGDGAIKGLYSGQIVPAPARATAVARQPETHEVYATG